MTTSTVQLKLEAAVPRADPCHACGSDRATGRPSRFIRETGITCYACKISGDKGDLRV